MRFFPFAERDTVLLSLPVAPIGGKMMVVRSMVRGLKLVCVEPKSDPLASLQLPDGDATYGEYQEEIKLASFTPMQMSTILDILILSKNFGR